MAINESSTQKPVAVARIFESENAHALTATTHDLAYEVDVLSQFKANLQQVEDLNSRLRFVLGEVSHLIKKS